MTEVNFCSTPSMWPVLAPHHLLCITRHYEGQEQPARSVFSGSGHNLVLPCGYLALKQNHTKGCNRIHKKLKRELHTAKCRFMKLVSALISVDVCSRLK